MRYYGDVAEAALRAATELDKAARGRDCVPTHVSRLARELVGLAGEPEFTMELKAVVERGGASGLRTVDDLVAALSSRSSEMMKALEGDASSAASSLTFCLDMHAQFLARSVEEWNYLGFAA